MEMKHRIMHYNQTEDLFQKIEGQHIYTWQELEENPILRDDLYIYHVKNTRLIKIIFKSTALKNGEVIYISLGSNYDGVLLGIDLISQDCADITNPTSEEKKSFLMGITSPDLLLIKNISNMNKMTFVLPGFLEKTISYNDDGTFKETLTTQVLFDDKALSKTNTTEFTPTEDYHPATKKYVDDAIAAALAARDAASTSET